MTSSLASELNHLRLDPDTLRRTLRHYLAELVEDPHPAEMREEMGEQAGTEAVGHAVAALAGDESLLDSAALLVLSAAWDEPEQQEPLRAAAARAAAEPHGGDLTELATACLYGLYLLATGGITRHPATIVRNAEGGFEERTLHAGPGDGLAAMLALFRRPD